jgi:hypothetical protein
MTHENSHEEFKKILNKYYPMNYPYRLASHCPTPEMIRTPACPSDCSICLVNEFISLLEDEGWISPEDCKDCQQRQVDRMEALK